MIQGDLELQTHLPAPINEALSADRRGPSKAILFQDGSGRAVGCASMSIWQGAAIKSAGIRPLSVDSKLGYVGDLRLRADAPRAVWQGWRQAYRELIADMLDPGHSSCVKGLVTSVLDQNVRATNALLRGRDGIAYDPLLRSTSFSFPLVDGLSCEAGPGYDFRGNIHRKWRINSGELKSVFSFVDGPLDEAQGWDELFGAAAGKASTRL